jgi:cytochrome c-type biogenesis protein CcmH/NrfF
MHEIPPEFIKIILLIVIIACFLIFALVIVGSIFLSSEQEQEEDKPQPLGQNIKCPACGAVNYAEVETGAILGFDTYVHECIVCGYVITESHWEEVK